MDGRASRFSWLVAVIAVVALVVGAVAAYAFSSGDNPGTTGPATITWTGQGAHDGELDTVQCDAASTPGGTADEPYLFWILSTDGGSAADAELTLTGDWGSETYSGTANAAQSRWQFTTAFHPPTTASLDASAAFDVTATGGGGWILTISHGCAGGGGDDPPLEVVKTAQGSATTTYTWDVAKAADPTVAHESGGATVDVAYAVTVTHDAGTTSHLLTGTITVSNPNDGDATGVTITDTVDNGGTCTIDGGGDDLTVEPGSASFDYTCAYATAPTKLTGIVNTVTVTWPTQPLDGAVLPAGTATFVSDPFDVVVDTVDECVSVTDAFNGAAPVATAPGQVCVGDATPTVITYTRTVSAVSNVCHTFDNTATITTNDTETTDSAGASVEVCGNVTGGLTIGFWQNKNGQDLIKTAPATAGVCSLTSVLRAYAPFADLDASASCTRVATYVTNVVKAANASGASMNAMLKAQMLATALSVWRTPSLGTTHVDLTLICRSVGTCSDPDTDPGQFVDTSSAFDNPPAGDCRTVDALLTFAASRSNPGGSTWYGNVKSVQELAKNTFDTIDNNKAWAC